MTRDHMSSQLSPEEFDTPITWALSQIDLTQSKGERPGECLMKLQSSTILEEKLTLNSLMKPHIQDI
jgi:hypothetical protein